MKPSVVRISDAGYGHPVSTFTQGYAVEAKGRLIFLSGITARNAEATVVGVGDIDAQCRQIFNNIKGILETAGSTLDDVVRTNAFVTHANYMEVYRSIKEEFFGASGPPGTVVQVVALYDPRQLIEIEVIAVAD